MINSKKLTDFFVVSIFHPWLPTIILSVHPSREKAEEDAVITSKHVQAPWEVIVRNCLDAIEDCHVLTNATEVCDGVRLIAGNLKIDE